MTRTLALLIAIFSLLLLGGCQNLFSPAGSPASTSLTVRTTQYDEIFTALEKSVNDQHAAGYITVADKVKLAPVVHGGRAALDDMAAAAKAVPPNLNAWQTSLDALSAALKTMQAAELAGKQKAAAAAAAGPITTH